MISMIASTFIFIPPFFRLFEPAAKVDIVVVVNDVSLPFAEFAGGGLWERHLARKCSHRFAPAKRGTVQ